MLLHISAQRQLYLTVVAPGCSWHFELLLFILCCGSKPVTFVLQDMLSLVSVGTDVPARLVADRVRLYIAEVMPLIAANRDHVLDVHTQYTDGLEDFVKSVFVRGIEDAIAARDAWHHDKVSQGSSPHMLCSLVSLNS